MPAATTAAPDAELAADRRLFRALPAPASLVDAAGLVVDVNDAFLAYARSQEIDVRREDRVGRPVWEFAGPGLRPQVEAIHAQLFAAGGPVEATLIMADRAARWPQLSASLVPAGQGTLALFLWRDVSPTVWAYQRARAVARLREAVWRMASPEDLEAVMLAAREGLVACGVPLAFCGANQVEVGPAPRVRMFLWDGTFGDWLAGDHPIAAFIAALHRAGRTAYRRDLAAQDEHGEGRWLHGVRSAVDVPFSDGTLAISSPQPDAFSEQDIALLEEMAAVLSEGFGRLRDLERADRALRRAEALAQGIETVATEDDLQVVFERACEQAAGLTGTSMAALFLYDEPHGVLVPQAHVGHDPDVYARMRLAPGEGLSGQVFASGRPLRLDGAALCDITPPSVRDLWSEAADGPFALGAAGAPLRVDGRIVGTLSVGTEEGAFTAADLAALERLAQQVGLAIERHTHFEAAEEARRSEQEAYRRQLARQAVREATWSMASSKDFSGVLRAVQHSLRGLGVPFYRFSVSLVEPPDDPDSVVTWDPREEEFATYSLQSTRVLLDIWARGVPAYRRDLRQEDPYGEAEGLRRAWGADIRCVLDVPFDRGTIAVNSTQPAAFSERDIGHIRAVGEYLAEGLRRREDLLRLEARTDELAESERLLSAFQHIAASTLVSLDLEDLLDSVAREVLRAGIFRSMMVALVDHDRHRVQVVRSFACRKTPDEGFVPGDIAVNDSAVSGFTYDLDDDNTTAVTARTGALQVVEELDKHLDPRFDRPAHWEDKVAYFIPVKHGERTVAVFGTGSRRAEKVETLRRIEAMAPLLTQIASAIDHARLHHEVATQRQQLAAANEELTRELSLQVALAELRERIWSMRDLADLPEALSVVRRTLDAVDIDCADCGINLVNDEAPSQVTMLTLQADGNVRQFRLRPTDDLAVDHGVEGIVGFLRRGEVVVRRLGDPRCAAELRDIARQLGHPVAAVVDVPFPGGTLAANSDSPDAFSEADIAILRRIAGVVGEGVRRAADLQALAEAEERFRHISEASGDVLWEVAVDEAGGARQVWRSADLDWDLDPHKAWSEYVHADDRATHRAYWERALAGQRSSCEFRVVLDDGTVRWLRALCNPAEIGGRRRRLFGATTDITEAKRVEQALVDSEATYRAIFEGVSDALFIHDEVTGQILAVNGAAEALLGRDREELLRTGVGDFSAGPPFTQGRARRWIHQARDEGPQCFEWQLRHPSGDALWVEVTLLRLQIAGTWRVLADLRDIGEQVAARTLRRDLALQGVRAQEDERRRISRELHDGVNQILTAAAAQLHLVRMGPEGDAGTQGLGKLQSYLDETIREVRRISRDLRPSILDDLGLEAALRSLLRRTTEEHGLETALACDEPGPLPVDTATTAYRVAQVALANVVQHAQARHVEATLRRDGARLRMTLRDDGVGFDVPKALQAHTGSIGLRSTRERVELLGGDLDVHSLIGLGTTVALALPLPPEDVT